MFWWGLYGWPPLSCPWGCLVPHVWKSKVWTFWFFLLPWLPLGLGDFLVALLGWSSVLGLRIVGGLTLWKGMVGPTLFSLHWYAESISLWVFSSASPLGLELTQRRISLGKEKKMIYLIFVVFLVTASITVGGLFFFLGLFQA